MRSFLVISLLTCLMIACRSGSHFTTRKYMSGRYVSGPARFHHVKASCAKENIQSVLTVLPSKTKDESASQPDIYAMVDATPTQEEMRGKRNQQVVSLNLIGKNNSRHGTQRFAPKLLPAALVTKSKSPKSDPETQKRRISFKSLASVLLSGFGLVINAGIFLIAILSSEYLYLPLLIIGVILGITGGLLGLSSIRDYKTDREKIYKRRKSMIFGIVGAAMGLAAIVVVAYLGVIAVIAPLGAP